MKAQVNVNAARVGQMIATRKGSARIIQIDEYTDSRGIRVQGVNSSAADGYYLVSRTDHPLTVLS